MRIALYEDDQAHAFGPLAMLRPVFELVCGRYCIRERLVSEFAPACWGAFVRPALHDVYQEEFPDANVNNPDWLRTGRTLMLNGRWLPPTGWQPTELAEHTVAVLGEEIVAMWVDAADADRFHGTAWAEAIRTLAITRTRKHVDGVLLARPWDLIDQNATQLRLQFARAQSTAENMAEPCAADSHVAFLGPIDQIQIAATAEIDPFVVIDARRGPVTISESARIQSFTRLEGPCHIGTETQVFRALIRGGTTIGPMCRVGGEIEETIIHGYANKYHEGFLGHSYVCPWVNLGAMTTNSDLKNDYSPVQVPVNGAAVATGSTKVGCFLGDHVKTGLDSMFNTGSSIGPFAMVLPAGRLLPKYVPAFARVWHGELAESWPLERLLETARTVMARRGRELSPAYTRLVQHVFHQTQHDRSRAVGGPRQRLRAA